MVRTRARAFAAALALGAAAPLTAQTPGDEPSFVVLPPRPLKLPQYALDPTSAEIPVGFFTTSLSPNVQRPPAPAPQAGQVRPFWLTAPQSQNALNYSPRPAQPNPGAFQMQPLTGGVQKPKAYPALTAPMSAPAWRWHGYGTVAAGDAQPTTPGAMNAANGSLNIPTFTTTIAPQFPAGIVVPQPSTPLPMPTGLPMPVNDSSGIQALPSFAPLPAGPEASPFPPAGTGDAGWKPSERLSIVPTNPMTADPTVVPAHAIATDRVGWLPTGQTVVAAAARTRTQDVGECDAPPVRPAFVPALPPAKPAAPVVTPSPEALTALHSAIERLIVGRGNELEMYQRDATSLLIRFKVRNNPDAESLANAISKLAGLAAFQVVYEIGIIP